MIIIDNIGPAEDINFIVQDSYLNNFREDLEIRFFGYYGRPAVYPCTVAIWKIKYKQP